jgi:carbohydrate-binding DOMON domain-containing protein
MADMHKHHEKVVKAFSEHMKPVLEHSAQPILIYLDDHHKACNKKFASLMGYASPKAFNDTNVNFVEAFIDEKSQGTVVKNYHTTFSEKLSASTFSVTVKKKSGKRAKTTVIHVPVFFEGHLFAVLYVTKQG